MMIPMGLLFFCAEILDGQMVDSLTQLDMRKPESRSGVGVLKGSPFLGTLNGRTVEKLCQREPILKVGVVKVVIRF